MKHFTSKLRRMYDPSRPRVVIAGGNFAGLETAVRLPAHFRVTVVDPRLSFEFTPNIHELVSGCKQPEQLRLNKEQILGRCGHDFFQDTATTIDPKNSRLTTASGVSFGYDACVVAIGGINNPGAVKDPNQLLMPFKAIRDCQAIGIRLRQLAGKGDPVRLVIVGGGLEGIESLGEVLRAYRHKADVAVNLIESEKALLPSAPRVVDSEIRRICEDQPVTFHFNERLTRASKTRITLGSGTQLPSDLIIWTGGIIAPPELSAWGLKKEDDPWAPVHNTLQSRYFENVFVAGDAAMLPEPISKQAYHGLDMGRHTAQNLKRLFSGEPLLPFAPSGKPMVLSFGDLDTFMIRGDRVLAGTALAAAKEAVYQYVMAHFDPARRTGYVASTLQRAAVGGIHLTSTHLKSFDSILRLGKIRIL